MTFRRSAPADGTSGSPTPSPWAKRAGLAIGAVVVGGVVAFLALGPRGGQTAALFLREGATFDEIQEVLDHLLTEPWDDETRRYVAGIDSVRPGGYADGRAILDLYLEPMGAGARDAMFRRFEASPLVDTVVLRSEAFGSN